MHVASKRKFCKSTGYLVRRRCEGKFYIILPCYYPDRDLYVSIPVQTSIN